MRRNLILCLLHLMMAVLVVGIGLMAPAALAAGELCALGCAFLLNGAIIAVMWLTHRSREAYYRNGVIRLFPHAA